MQSYAYFISLINHLDATDASSSSIGKYIWGIVIILLAIVLAAGFLIMKLLKSLRDQRERLRSLTEVELREFLEGNPHLIEATEDYIPFQALAYNREYEIPYDYLTIGKNP